MHLTTFLSGPHIFSQLLLGNQIMCGWNFEIAISNIWNLKTWLSNCTNEVNKPRVCVCVFGSEILIMPRRIDSTLSF